MNNNLREIKLGAPPSIVLSKGCPNAELSAQVMQNCEELVLKDDGSKCTTQGAIKTAAALLGQRVNEDVSEQDRYTPTDEEKPIKVDIQGGGEVTGKEINALYNALDLYTDNSNIVGNVTCQGCYEQDKIALEARFHDFHIESTVYFVHFADPEVERVLVKNGVGNEFGITVEQLAAVTDIKDWFTNNTKIVSFEELSYTSITSFNCRNISTFWGCQNLERIGVENIRSFIDNSHGFLSSDKIEELNFESLETVSIWYGTLIKCPNLKKIRCLKLVGNPTGYYTYYFIDGGIYKFLPLPSVETIGLGSFGNNKSLLLVDFGKKLSSIKYERNCPAFYGCTGIKIYIIRNTILPTLIDYKALGGNSGFAIFVPSSATEMYKAAEQWSNYSSRIFPIGGPEWQTAMQSLAEEEGYELKPVQSFSDAYIDYDIYGIPEEDRPFVSFKDAEVEAVLAKNGVGGDGLITKEALEGVTSIETWFATYEGENTDFLNLMKNVTVLSGVPSFTNVDVVNGDYVKTVNGQAFYNAYSNIKAILLHSFEETQFFTAFSHCTTPLVDLGDKVKKIYAIQSGVKYHIFGIENNSNSSMKNSTAILRTNEVLEYGKDIASPQKWYLRNNVIPLYSTQEVWSTKTLLAIGGQEWCDQFNIEHKPEYDTMSYEELPTEVKYADYIYHGVKPPTE